MPSEIDQRGEMKFKKVAAIGFEPATKDLETMLFYQADTTM